MEEIFTQVLCSLPASIMLCIKARHALSSPASRVCGNSLCGELFTALQIDKTKLSHLGDEMSGAVTLFRSLVCVGCPLPAE